MRLRLIILFVVLLQLSRPKYLATAVEEEVEPEQLSEEEDDPPYEKKLSPRERLAMEEEERWQRDREEVERREREEALHKAERDNQQDYEEAEEDMETSEPTEELYERKLSPRERIALENEERWQRTLEEVERREREEALQASDLTQEVEADAREKASEGQYEQAIENNYPRDEEDAYISYLERQRRLEEPDEEALPVIPGLTDVELIAFNAEYANEGVLDKIIDWSYDQVAGISRYRDNYIHVEDLYQFLLKTLNPLDEEIDAEDEQILTDAVTELCRQQGLVDEEQIVYRGFIARGMPLRFLQSLAHKMHQTVQTRRLQASVGRDEL